MSSLKPLQSSALMVHTATLLKQKLGSQNAESAFQILTQRQIQQSLKVIQAITTKEDFERYQLKKAAVLVPILDIASKGPSILFTKRSSQTGTHKNEISFPGGHYDPHLDGDSLYRTAIRETMEELLPQSLQQQQSDHPQYDFESGVELVGHTSTIPSMKGIPVTSILGVFLHAFPDQHSVSKIYFPGNTSEVSLVFTVSITELIKSETSEPLPRMGPGNVGPVFVTEHGKIWGLTAIILRPILHQLLKPIFSL